MNSDFKDQFNYLVAFLAVLAGLMVFKDEASARHILVFGRDYSWLQLSLPFVGTMAVATYAGALTLLVKRWNFTWFALGKYLELFSYAIATLGLLYPLLVPVSLLVSYSVAHLHADTMSKVAIVSTVLQLVVMAYGAVRLASSREKEKISAQLSFMGELQTKVIRAEGKTAREPVDVKALQMQAIERYSYVVDRAKAYLRLRGFGVSGESLGRIAQILRSKGVFDDSDVQKATRITNIRNMYVHAPSNMTAPASPKRVLDMLEKLNAKLSDAYYELSQYIDDSGPAPSS